MSDTITDNAPAEAVPTYAEILETALEPGLNDKLVSYEPAREHLGIIVNPTDEDGEREGEWARDGEGRHLRFIPAIDRVVVSSNATEVAGVELIRSERNRHAIKGYDASHDAEHADGSISRLAAWLAAHEDSDTVICLPVWASQYADWVLAKYASDRIRQLTIAGSLIAAEIDRLRLITLAKAVSPQ